MPHASQKQLKTAIAEAEQEIEVPTYVDLGSDEEAQAGGKKPLKVTPKRKRRIAAVDSSKDEEDEEDEQEEENDGKEMDGDFGVDELCRKTEFEVRRCPWRVWLLKRARAISSPWRVLACRMILHSTTSEGSGTIVTGPCCEGVCRMGNRKLSRGGATTRSARCRPRSLSPDPAMITSRFASVPSYSSRSSKWMWRSPFWSLSTRWRYSFPTTTPSSNVPWTSERYSAS